MKQLVIDIETRPNLAYVWSIWDENIALNHLIESNEVYCFAAKWLNDRKMHFFSVNDVGKQAMIENAWTLINDADSVIHYNGRSFDMKHLNREFLELGMSPPSPVQQLDLLSTVKKKFRFPSNKLEYVADRLGVGQKLKHEGFDMWKRCMAGDQDAWKLMEKYNRNDVAMTEELYYKLMPWITGAPSFSIMDEDDGICPQCGSNKLLRRGFYYTAQRKYRRFVCDNCGKWSRETTVFKNPDTGRNASVTIKGVD